MRVLSHLIAITATALLCSAASVAAKPAGDDDVIAVVAALDWNITDSSLDSPSDGSFGEVESEGDVPVVSRTPTSVPSIAPSPVPGLCRKNEEEMSVEGVVGVFCVPKGKGCSGPNDGGVCPDKQAGLPHGSYCGRVVTGVFGCKPYFPYSDKDNKDPDDIVNDADKDDEKKEDHGNNGGHGNNGDRGGNGDDEGSGESQNSETSSLGGSNSA